MAISVPKPKVGILGQLVRDVGFFGSFRLRGRRTWNLCKQCLAQSESVHSTACAKVIYRLALWTVCDSNAVLTDEQPQSLLVSGGWTLYKNGRFRCTGNFAASVKFYTDSVSWCDGNMAFVTVTQCGRNWTETGFHEVVGDSHAGANLISSSFKHPRSVEWPLLTSSEWNFIIIITWCLKFFSIMNSFNQLWPKDKAGLLFQSWPWFLFSTSDILFRGQR